MMLSAGIEPLMQVRFMVLPLRTVILGPPMISAIGAIKSTDFSIVAHMHRCYVSHEKEQ